MENERGKLGNRLGDFGTEPRDIVWNAIEEKLAKRRKKRPVFWWIAAGLLLTLGVGSWFFWPNESGTTITPSVSSIPQKENTTHSSEIKEANTTKQNDSKEIGTIAKGNVQTPSMLPETKNSIPERQENKATPELTTNPLTDLNSPQKTRKRKAANYGLTLAPTHAIKTSSRKLSSENSAIKSENQPLAIDAPLKKPVEKESSKNDAVAKKDESKNPQVNEEGVVNSTKPQNIEISTDKVEINPLVNNPEESKSIHQIAVQEKKGIDSLKKNQELPEAEKPEILVEKPENKPNEAVSKWHFTVFGGPKAALFRDIAINQNQTENPLVLETSETKIWQRLGFDGGFQASWSFSPQWNFLMNTGFSFVQENLSGIRKRRINDAYDLETNGNTLMVNPVIVNETFALQSKQLALFTGVGLGYSLQPGLELHGQFGLQYRLFQQESFTFGESKTTTSSSFQISPADFYFQFCVEKVWLVSDRRWGIKPMVQFFPQPLFELPVGTTTKPIYSGIQVSYGW